MSESEELSYYRLDSALDWSEGSRTFRATDTRSGATVAVKLISPGAGARPEAVRRRFGAAAGILRTLDHPNLPSVLDFGFTDTGDAFLVQEWVDGVGLDTLRNESPEQILSYMLQVIEGLECLALHGLLHLNLTPDNVLATPDGQIRIVGLGVSLLRGERYGESDIDDLEARFAAPELQAATAFDAALWRADLYSVSRITCDLLGALVAGEGTPEPEVELPDRVKNELENTGELAEVLASCLRWDPAERPASYGAVRAGLQHALRRSARHDQALLDTQPFEIPDITVVAEDVDAFATHAEILAAGEPEAATAPAAETTLSPPSLETEEATPGETPTTAVPPAVETVEVLQPVEEWLGQESPELASQGETAAVEGRSTAAEVEPAPVPTSGFTLPRTTDDTVDFKLGDETRPSLVPPPSLPRPPQPPSSKLKQRSFWLWLAGAAAVLGISLVLLVVWMDLSKQEMAPQPAWEAPLTMPAASEIPLPPAEPESLHSEIEATLGLLVDGRLLEARATVMDGQLLDPAAFSQGDCVAYLTLIETIRNERVLEVTAELNSGFWSGDLDRLESALDSLSPQETAALAMVEAPRRRLAKARATVDRYREVRQALEAGDLSGALDGAQTLLEDFPRSSRALDLREAAASALERDAQALAAAGELEGARRQLRALGELWPDRPGIESRIEALEAREISTQRMEALLVAAADAEKRQRPHEGLRLLENVSPAPAFVETIRSTRRRLERQLAELDQQPPMIELDPTAELEYRKASPAILQLRISDDYHLDRAAAFGRKEDSSAVVELPLSQVEGDLYQIEIKPSFHQEQPVELWVEASDLSGQVSRLGSSDEPLRIRRKRWFR